MVALDKETTEAVIPRVADLQGVVPRLVHPPTMLRELQKLGAVQDLLRAPHTETLMGGILIGLAIAEGVLGVDFTNAGGPGT